MQITLPKLTLVLGGAACGKSALAERLIFGTGLRRTYIATAQAYDEEMAAKVAAHKTQRGPDWTTVEEPLDLPKALAQTEDVTLIDCATLWLTNLILANQDINEATAKLLHALLQRPAPVVIVSNETGQGIVPDNALARQFRNAQGTLNQNLAAQADLVILTVAGLPLILKGNDPGLNAAHALPAGKS